jgi:diacylglycerol kinase family enzyme
MVIGFVPIFETEVGKILGIKNVEQAAKTLGGRRIAELDLGSVNGNLFVSKLSFGILQSNNLGWFRALNFRLVKNLFHLPNFEINFSVDGKYSARLKAIGGVIINSRNDTGNGHSDPTDGILDVLLLSKLSKWNTYKFRKEILTGNFDKIPGSSMVHVKRLEIITPEGLPLRTGSRVIAKTPAAIEVLPRALKIIVGRDRKF